jgi:hypothetical protein
MELLPAALLILLRVFVVKNSAHSRKGLNDRRSVHAMAPARKGV